MESTGELKIQEIGGKECVLVTLKKIATTKPVTVAFYATVNKAMLSTTMTINVASDAEFVYKTDQMCIRDSWYPGSSGRGWQQ